VGEDKFREKAKKTKAQIDEINNQKRIDNKKKKESGNKGILKGMENMPSTEEKEAVKEEVFNKEEKVVRSYSLRKEIIDMLEEMFKSSNLSKSEIVETGIENLYKNIFE